MELTGKWIELGGGSNPHPSCQVNVDVRPGERVHFTQNFEETPWKIADSEWNGVFSRYALEHLSWRKLPAALAEIYRILKPGGRLLLYLPNTAAQISWIRDHPEGWDGKSLFESCSCVLFGDQDYSDNCHRCYLEPVIVIDLLSKAGFHSIQVQPHGERKTDMEVKASKPDLPITTGLPVETKVLPTSGVAQKVVLAPMEASHPLRGVPADQLYDRHYFCGGGKVGGYAREGYWDYPVHEVTARHVLARKPESVLEIGCARGYVLKRIQDAGVPGTGLEVSRHCYMTRAVNDIHLFDLCKTRSVTESEHQNPGRSLFPFASHLVSLASPEINQRYPFDLCYSVATLEHIPEQHLPAVLLEMERVAKRQLHGIDFGGHDDGFDKTHCTLHPKEWWIELFKWVYDAVERDIPVEIVDKEDLEWGTIPDEVLRGDGKVKLNVGCAMTMFQRGWINLDVHDLDGFAKQWGYNYRRHDVRQGLPWMTESVDLVNASHLLDRLTYREGLSFLKECRRVLRPDGALRVAVPDGQLLMDFYAHEGEEDLSYDTFMTRLADYGEVCESCAEARTNAARLHALLHEGRSSVHDAESVVSMMDEAGFTAQTTTFRYPYPVGSLGDQLARETLEELPCLSLYVFAVPRVDY